MGGKPIFRHACFRSGRQVGRAHAGIELRIARIAFGVDAELGPTLGFLRPVGIDDEIDPIATC